MDSHKSDNTIASSYFESNYGSTNATTMKNAQHAMHNINSHAVAKKTWRSQSVGVQGPQSNRASRSSTATPDRDTRSASTSRSGPMFSYLSLIPQDGSFPHRTHPIGDTQTQRRDSVTSGMSRSGSQDYLNQTAKKNFMVRSNPIGLAEPSVKRDGYSVGRDGSFYRSSEHLFESKTNQSKSRASSETPESGSWRERRRSSASSTGTGIRLGGGLIETGKPASSAKVFMPFGTATVTPSYLKKTSRSSSSTVSKQSTTTQEFNIQKSTQEIQSLTQAVTTDMTFKEVDLALTNISKQEHETINVTIAAKKPKRARSLSRKDVVLPDQSVTISLPGSRRTSRQPSVDRDVGMKKSSRSSSVEMFSGEYKMKLPKKSGKAQAKVEEISTDHVSMRANTDESEEAHAQATVKIPAPPPPPPPPKPPAPIVLPKKSKLKQEESTAVVKQEVSSSKSVLSRSESLKTTKVTSTTKVEHQETHVKGHTFNITKPLRRSQDDVRKSRHVSGEKSQIGGHLKGLDVALEALARQQKEQEMKKTNRNSMIISKTQKEDGVTSVTVSLPASKRASRRGSVDLNNPPAQIRSRRNSMDLYSADYNVRLSRKGSELALQQKSACHIRVDDSNASKIKLCSRCHDPSHDAANCKDFGDLKCPRCMEWDHWEDTCWTNKSSEDKKLCESCKVLGHSSPVHDAKDYKQRRAIVDTLGWETFTEWFYETDFRSWWQLNGCVGVPLYRLYKRNTEWRSGEVVMNEDDEQAVEGRLNDSSLEERASILQAKYKSNYSLKREDSTDELIKSIKANAKKRVEAETDLNSGRSTPEHLKKYSAESCASESKRLRTFSETLRMLDDDVVADLNVK